MANRDDLDDRDWSAINALVEDAIEGRLTGASGWRRADCPFCEDRTGKADKRQSFAFNTATGGYVCNRCQTRGRLPGWGESQDVYSPAVALAAPALAAPEVESVQGFVSLGMWPGVSAEATSYPREYLQRRGVSAEAVLRCGVGCTLDGPHRGRIVVPHAFQGATENPWGGWIGRDFTDAQDLRYRYSRGLRRDRLWRQHALDKVTTEPLLLVEGVFDALPHWPNAAAFLGKPTLAHVQHLSRHRGRPFVVALDGDAHEEGWALAQKLRFMGAPSGFLRLPPGEDPGSLGLRWFAEHMAQAFIF